jgi:hypothetical protein
MWSSVLTFLLPGFVSAAVFYSFTSHPKPSEFERVVQALIFTIFVQALVGVARASALWVGSLLGPREQQAAPRVRRLTIGLQ